MTPGAAARGSRSGILSTVIGCAALAPMPPLAAPPHAARACPPVLAPRPPLGYAARRSRGARPAAPGRQAACGSRQTRLGQLAAEKHGTVSAGLAQGYGMRLEKTCKSFLAVARPQASRGSKAGLQASSQTPGSPPAQRSLRIMPWNGAILWFPDDQQSGAAAVSANHEASGVSVTMQGLVVLIHRTRPRDRLSRKHVRQTVIAGVGDFCPTALKNLRR